MKNYFNRISCLIRPDLENSISRALLRFSTYMFLLIVLPSSIFFEKFISLNEAISCISYLSYPFKINLSFFEIYILLIALKVSSVFCAIGFLFQLSSIVSVLSFSLLILHSLASCYSNHYFYPVGIVLLLWAINSESNPWSIDYFLFSKKNLKRPHYIFKFLKIHFSLIFFFSGLSKLRSAGFEWIFSDNLRNRVIMQNFFHDGFFGKIKFEKINHLFISDSNIMITLAFLTIIIEVSAVSLLITKRYAGLIVFLLLCFQLGVVAIMYINFFPWIIVYLVWIFSFVDRFTQSKQASLCSIQIKY